MRWPGTLAAALAATTLVASVMNLAATITQNTPLP